MIVLHALRPIIIYSVVCMCMHNYDCAACTQAQLAEQIAAKENEKHKVRLAKQMADAEEASRLQQERHRLNEQYQREAAEKRRKEVSTRMHSKTCMHGSQ